jgi:hypothetical protein
VSFSDLISEMDARLEAKPSAETFWEEIPALFSKVLAEGLHIKALNSLLAAVRDENMLVTAQHTAGQFVALHISPFSSWAIIFHKVPHQFLYLSPVDALQTAIGGADLEVTRYTCEQPSTFEVLQRDLPIVAGEPEAAPRGAIFTRHGCREILDWQTVAGADRPGVTLRVNSGLRAEFEWAVDRQTRRPVGLSGIDQVRSNLITIFSLLSSVGDPQSIEHLRPFLGADKHFVRWSAARTIAAIDAGEGLASVEALADDPHEEVRRAARNALAGLASAA